ncbi:hypothetical protein Acr_12g0010060 [Actinidia rufa]|uniref:Uncharacterized protein n=1 Tax=Actinidia rufa TaxID=165716 RepID=A0A7J0FID9_9ERIC|nr:hypothetical protein Acr_12g0010060 [Actinidia rufa]
MWGKFSINQGKYVALAPPQNWSPLISPEVAHLRTLLTEVKRVHEPRQVISTELARATIRVLYELAQSQSAAPPRLWRGRILGLINLHQNPPESYLYMETIHYEIFSTTIPTITGYSPDAISPIMSLYLRISFHTHPSEDHAVTHGTAITPSIKKAAPPLNKGTHAHILYNFSFELFIHGHCLGLITTPEGFKRPRPALHLCSSVQVALYLSEVQYRGTRAIVTVGCSLQFFTTTKPIIISLASSFE